MRVVFTGPSLPSAVVRAALPGALVRPPACRGDLDRAVADGAGQILIIDGGFAHRFAVAPSEVVSALRAGVQVLGAASLGAIRAAECHPAGMVGVGAVQRLYRLRVLRDDDEVAVATEPDRDFRATSIALVNVRFAVLRGLRAGQLERAAAQRVLTAAKRMHFSERLWEPILAQAGVRAWEGLAAGADVKRRDAELAVARLAELPRLDARRSRPAPGRPDPEAPVFGQPRARARTELCAWLVASGRYRAYWDRPPDDPDRAWTQLAQRHDLDYELMRWHAVVRGCEMGRDAAPADTEPARTVVARAHGYPDWDQLDAAAVAGQLPSGVGVDEIQVAAARLARARQGLRASG